MRDVVPRGLNAKIRELTARVEAPQNRITELNNDIGELLHEVETQANEIIQKDIDIHDLVEHRYVPRRHLVDNVLCFVDKRSETDNHPYYVIRCQYRSLENHKKWLRARYPNMQVIGECDDANAIHRWYRFKEDVIMRPNFYRNHFSLDTVEKQELFDTTFDIEV